MIVKLRVLIAKKLAVIAYDRLIAAQWSKSYYPPGSYGYAVSELSLAYADLLTEIAKAIGPPMPDDPD